MKIIGCDFHPSFQQIAMVDTETGERTEHKLTPEEAKQFYGQLQGEVVVGVEASGNMLWFERLLAGMGHRLRLGDATRIQAREVRKQKTDRRAADLILQLMLEEAKQFYGQLQGEVVVGVEASGNMLWFERLLAGMGHRLRLGDATRIQAREVRKQKTDRRAAELILQLMLENRFPEIWVPSLAERDARQLLLHRYKLVGMRRQVKNQLQHLAMNQGLQLKYRLWTQVGRKRLEELPLEGWTARRREDGLRWLDQLDHDLAELDAAVARQAQQNAVAQLLQTHPGVGPITSLAFVLTLGKIERFRGSRQVVSYLGLNPSEHSSGMRRRLGAISKQGNPMLRSLLVEAGQSASRWDKELKRAYQRLKQKKHSAVAKVMVARKLAVRLYWMWRTQQPYTATRTQGSPSHLVAGK